MTGSPGAGKSTLVAQIAAESVQRGEKLAVVAYDPMSPITGGALLGDRLRVDFGRVDESVFYRSLAIAGEDYETLPEILELNSPNTTFLPDVVALSTVASGPLPAPFVFWSGVWSLWTGLLFDLPMPVQPMHAVVAVALTEGLTYPQVVASGVWLGAMFFLLGAAPRLVSWLQTHTPLAVVRGLQLGLGLKVVATGVSFVSEPRGFANLGPGGNGDGWGFALFPPDPPSPPK